MITIKKKYTTQNIQNYALNYVNKFGTSKNYLTQFLIKKIKNRFIVESSKQLLYDVEAVVSKLVNLGYINDTAFCESRIKGLLKEGNSIFSITLKLQQKQISKEIIQQAFNNIINPDPFLLNNTNNNIEELENYSLLKYAKKRNLLYWQHPNSYSEYNKSKALATLQRRGFNFTLINNLLNYNNLLNTNYEKFTNYINKIEINYNL